MIVPVPPLGGLKKIIAVVLSTVRAVVIVGGFGFVVTELDAPDETEVPPELVEVAVNV